MDWIDINNFYYSKDELPGEFGKGYGIGSVIFARYKNKKEIIIEQEYLSYTKFEYFDDIPENMKHYIQTRRYKAIEYDDGTVTVFYFSPYGHFKDIIAYILIDDMLKELNKMQK